MSVIQILDDADVAFRISGAELRTVLSATTMLADKPHRLNGRTSVQRVYVLTILPPVTALTVGLPAQRAIARTGRALQAGCEQMEGVVLRICIRPLHGAFVLLAIMDIRAHPISFSERP